VDFALWIELILFIVLLGFSGFFSSTETSLFSLSAFQIEQMRQEKNPRLELIERLRSEPRRLIVTILIGNEFVNVAASVISAAMVIHVFGADNELINLLIMVPILLLFGEITPKVLAIRNNRAFATFESAPIQLFARLITPLRWVIRRISEFFISLLVGHERSRGNLVTEDMVRTLARDAVGEGALDSQEAQYIDQIFEFGNKTLEDIMTPRSDIRFLSVDLPVSELIAEVKAVRQSRYPVYKGHRDTILGILHARDLLGVDLAKLERDPQGIRKLLRETNFFPESKPAVELFHTFRKRNLSFALTVDEYGGVTGLVTMEDLLECVFGEIASPSDVSSNALVSELKDGRQAVDTAMPIVDFNRDFGAALDTEQAETLAGALLGAFGELPEAGAEIHIQGLRFRVEQVENNRITRVIIERLPAEAPERQLAVTATDADEEFSGTDQGSVVVDRHDDAPAAAPPPIPDATRREEV
jgi:putative hemolysin